MDTKVFLAEKTHDALFEVGKKVAKSLMLVSSLEVVLLLIQIGDLDNKITLPLVKIDVSKDITILLISIFAAFFIYRFFSYSTYENILEKKLEKILAEIGNKDPIWSVYYPSLHTFSTITRASGFLSLIKYFLFYLPLGIVLVVYPFLMIFEYPYNR